MAWRLLASDPKAGNSGVSVSFVCDKGRRDVETDGDRQSALRKTTYFVKLADYPPFSSVRTVRRRRTQELIVTHRLRPLVY